MALIIDPFDKYSIKGKIINVNDKSSTLTISVTSPFRGVIDFHCISEHYDILHPPVLSKYEWIDWVQDNAHPSVTEASAYYNTRDKCFYRKESGSESEWERTDFDDIYKDNRHLLTKNLNMQEKYQLFIYRYMSILHKEQLCHFSAYATHSLIEDTHSTRSKQVERHPEDYFWIYDPDTFQGEKWDAESIDGLVKEILPSRECLEELLIKEILPSRECLEELLKRHDAADGELKRKEWEERCERIKSIPKRVENFIGKYPRLLWLIITFGMLLVGIVSLIVTYSKD